MVETVSIFDVTQVEESWGAADDETYRTILGIFVPEAEGLCEALTVALEDDDRASLERHAHTLRGAAMNISGGRLGACAGEVEQAALTADKTHLAGLMTALQAALRATTAVIKGGGPSPDGGPSAAGGSAAIG